MKFRDYRRLVPRQNHVHVHDCQCVRHLTSRIQELNGGRSLISDFHLNIERLH